ncbi:MAG: recombinase family protein [Gammaproteobacteria bacterium]|nr:recombinase family protein [Gammaproteobacteria bacterium]
MAMRAVGYIRVSTSGQADEGVSLEAQQARIEAWCIANGYSLEQVFVDAGISGKAMQNREGLKSALNAVDKGTALICYSMSRLSRSTRDMLAIADRLERKGADLVSLTEKIDSTTAAGKMVFKMLAVLNEFERDLISERTTTALAHKRAKGQRIGTVPYGYRLENDRITLAEDPAEQAILQDIRALRAEGFTLKAIAEQLNNDGLLTRKGGQWRTQYVHNLLRTAA